MAEARLDPYRKALNKWEMHKALTGRKAESFSLPHTVPASVSNLHKMLQDYPTIYVKPIGGWGGRGITRISQLSATDAAPLRYRWQQEGQQPVVLASANAILQRFQLQYSMQPCILQEEAPLVRLPGNRPVDVRVLLQRNLEDEWILAGCLARVGGQGGVVSNVGISSGHVLTTDALFEKLGYSERRRRNVRSAIKQTQETIVHVLNRYRHFNEIGLDLGLDAKGHLWLIEVNTDDAIGGPSHELFAHLPDRQVYHAIQARQTAILLRRQRLY